MAAQSAVLGRAGGVGDALGDDRVGVALISRFGWILYVFGAFLLFTGFKMVFGKQEEIHPERNPVVRWFRNWCR